MLYAYLNILVSRSRDRPELQLLCLLTEILEGVIRGDDRHRVGRTSGSAATTAVAYVRASARLIDVYPLRAYPINRVNQDEFSNSAGVFVVVVVVIIPGR